jgi:hypothetical protein
MSEAHRPAGINNSDGFAALVRAYEALSLVTQLFDDPFGFICQRVAGHLADREAGAVLDELTITGPPVPLADGHLDYDDPAGEQFILTRVALFLPFTARVRSPAKGMESVQGALTFVVGNVNQPGNHVVRSWMDVDDWGLDRFMTPDEDAYRSRMFSVGTWLPGDYPPGSPERHAGGAGMSG